MPRWAGVVSTMAAGAAVVVALGFVLTGGDEEVAPARTFEATTSQETTAAPPEVSTLRVRVRRGSPVGGIEQLTVRQGERVRVLVVSDVADHVHVHGYDLMRDVAPGAPAAIAFRATLTGRFEIELEERGTPIAELEVRP